MGKRIKGLLTAIAGMALVVGMGIATGKPAKKATSVMADGPESITFSSSGYTNGETVSSVTGTHFTIEFTDGGTPTAYYDTGSAIRIYNGGSFTFAPTTGYTLTSIRLTYELNGAATLSCEDSSHWNSSTKTWSGTNQSVVFTAGSAKHVRLSAVSVEYSSASIAATINGANSVDVGTQWSPTSITEDVGGATVSGGDLTYAFATSNGASLSASSTANGTFTASAAGTVTVSATKTGYTIASKVVTVNPLDPYINLTLTSGATAFTGQTVTITAAYGNGVTGLNWSVPSGTVSGVTSNDSGYSATIGGIPGTLTIRATDKGSALYREVSVTVTKVSLSLNKNSTTIAQGQSETLTATHNASAVGGVTWTSNNAKVAVVGGVVTVAADAVIDSTATITATSSVDLSVAATCVVTVSEAPSESSWNLAIASYDANPTEELVQWSSAAANMVLTKNGAGTKANNYLGGDANNRTSSRFYTGQKLTIAPGIGLCIRSIIFTATSDGYATAFAGSSWTNASASASSKTVTVTPTTGTSDIVAIVGGTCGFTGVTIYYSEVWCQTFLDTFTCSGVTMEAPNGSITVANPTDVWASFKSSFSVLKATTKSELKTTEADEGGTIVQQALARYDLVIAKYKTTTYEDFIGRFDLGGANYAAKLGGLGSESSIDSSLPIILTMIVAGAVVAGGFAFMAKRHRKED